uniref:Cystatin domain-containing protein n=2 Tax=Chenopodium quinoa TaxID=63459 RepID=A0A803M4R2_CHEQI
MSSSAQQKNIAEGRHPVDPKDPHIQEIAAWAVAEYDKEHGKHLVYVKTLKAEEERNIGSTRYFIDLEASDDCKINKYSAKVLEIENQAHTKKLEEFKQKENAPILVAN